MWVPNDEMALCHQGHLGLRASIKDANPDVAKAALPEYESVCLPVNCRVAQWSTVLWGQVAVGCGSANHSDLKFNASILQKETQT